MHTIRYYFFTFRPPYTFYYACFFILGIVLQSLLHNASIINWYTSSIVLVTLFVVRIKNLPYAFFSYLGIVFFCLGAFLYTYQIHKQQAFYAAMHNKKTSISGTIRSIFHENSYPQRTRIELATSEISNSLLPNSLYIYTNFLSSLEVDDTIYIQDVLFKNSPPDDYARYLAREHINATLFIKKEQITLTNRPTYSFWRWLSHKKKQSYNSLQAKMSPRSFAFFSSLFLGDKKTNKKEMIAIKNNFKKWGISHYLARSGLHMIIFICIWQFMFIFLPLGFIYKDLLLIILTLCYCMLSTPSISFNRAVLAFLLYKLSSINGKQTNTLNTISLVTLLLLLYSPISVFFLDFQLSFGLAFLLAWLNQIATQKRIST